MIPLGDAWDSSLGLNYVASPWSSSQPLPSLRWSPQQKHPLCTTVTKSLLLERCRLLKVTFKEKNKNLVSPTHVLNNIFFFSKKKATLAMMGQDRRHTKNQKFRICMSTLPPDVKSGQGIPWVSFDPF